MFNNRFSSCKTLKDLQKTMEQVNYSTLSLEEIERIKAVFAANLPDEQELYLSNSLEYSALVAKITAFENKPKLTFSKEENIMNANTNPTIKNPDGSFNKDAIKDIIQNIAEDLSKIKSDTKEDIADNVESIKTHLTSVSGILDILGLSKLKADYDKVVYAGMNENGHVVHLDKMVAEISKLFREEIKRLDFWATDKTLAQSFTLKALIGEEYGTKNIFQAISATLLNVIKRGIEFVMNKFKMAEENAKSVVIKAILKGIRSVFSALIQGAIIVLKVVGKAISFVLCGVTAICHWAYNTFKKLILKLKEFISGKFKGKTIEEIIDDGVTEVSTEVIPQQ